MTVKNKTAASLMIFILIFAAQTAVAQERELSARIFLNSNPIRARIYVDGVPIEDSTPALITVEPGEHAIEIVKDERYAKFVLDVAPREVLSADIFLTGDHVTFGFAGEESVYAKGRRFPGDILLRVQDGDYRIDSLSDGVRIIPAYPKQSLIDRLDTAFVIFAGFSGLLTAGEFIRPKSVGFFPSPITITSYAATLLTGGLDLSYRIRRKGFYERYDVDSIEVIEADREAGALYRAAENALRINAQAEALRYYAVLLSEYPDYPRLPTVVYNSARIHYIGGMPDLAELEFALLIDEFPVPQYYDQSCRFLSDIAMKNGENGKAVEYLRRMVFLEEYLAFSRQEVDALILELTEASE